MTRYKKSERICNGEKKEAIKFNRKEEEAIFKNRREDDYKGKKQ